MAERETSPRRTFAPVVLVGVAAAGMAAWAGHHQWAATTAKTDLPVLGVSVDASQPLVSALAYVVLAAWGVLLVTRGRFRVAVAVLASVAALGDAVAAVVSLATAASNAEDAAATSAQLSFHLTAWAWVGTTAAVVAVVPAVLAVRLAPSWPEMGTRYDAPTGSSAAPDESDLALWRALDEGRDPTLPAERPTDP